jgi:phosphinothricin acetyltransferase
MALEVRLARESDAAGVLSIYAPIVKSTAISFELEPPSLDEIARRIARGSSWPFLVCGEGDTTLGYAYAVPFRERPAYRFTVESTVYVAEAARRRGVARGLYRSLLGCLALQGFARVVAGITLPNPASVALHEGLGFRPCALLERVGWKLDAWHDVGYWARGLGAGGTAEADDAPTREPSRTEEIASDPAFGAAVRAGVSELRR